MDFGTVPTVWYFSSGIFSYSTRIFLGNISAIVEKLKKRKIGKKYPFHQPIRRQHSDIKWNYFAFIFPVI
jgi:hypothetical protein